MPRIPTVLLLLLVAAAGAGEPKAPLVVFRTPDPDTRREILKLVSKGFDNTNRADRRQAREALKEIGPWAVLFLPDSFRRNPQCAQNAAITITMIGDRAGLPALRAAARRSNEWVGRTSCLALGHFGDPADAELLHGLLSDRRCRYRAAAALALAKLPGGGAVLASEELAKDEHVAAAQVLALAVAAPRHDLLPYLDRRRPVLVRLAAATGLVVRPRSAVDAAVLLDGLARPDAPKERALRARLLAALAAIPGRTPEIRDALVKAAQREKGEEARVAALIGLAAEWNVQSLFAELDRIQVRDRDPELGPLLFALGRTGAPEAIDRLLKELRKDGDRPFYAAGSLLYEVVATRDGKRHPREDEILVAVGEAKEIPRLSQLAKNLRGRERAEQRRIAAEAFADREHGDPHGHHLWDWTPEERAWATVNRLLPYLFALDDLADAGDPTKHAQSQGLGIKKDESDDSKRAPTQGKPAEQDLLDFLAGMAYFGPEDLRGR